MQLTDRELHAKMITIRQHERKASLDLLEHLQEVYDRRLFCDFGHSSIVKYLVRELGYSESAAFRRYQALKLSREIPQAKKMMEKGELNLTSAALIQGGLKDITQRKEILSEVINKTTGETQEMIVKMNPELKKRDIINPVMEDQSRVHLTLSKDTLEKLSLLKAKLKEYDTDQAINKALSLALEKLDITTTRTNRMKYVAHKSVPRSTVKKLHLRAKGKCEYPGCDEIHNLEIEHITPRAKGGRHVLSNLKLFCKAHNQRSAIKQFGIKKMHQFLN